MKLIILLKYSKQVICIQTYGVKVERQEEMVKEKKNVTVLLYCDTYF